MRRFIDFWVKGESLEQAVGLLKKLKELGFHSAVIEPSSDLLEGFEELRSEADRIGVKIYRKLVIEPSGRGDLLRALRKNRGSFEVITVLCRNLEAALVAARDSRVDSLIIPPNPEFRFDKGVASLIKNHVELPFNYFLEDKLSFLRTALRIVSILGRKVDIIVSSGAPDPLELRGPMELASLVQVLGYSQEKALDAVSKVPESILEENLVKLSKRYVARGVLRIDEEG